MSVGEEDHIKPAVQPLGSLDLWQIAIKPGKPFAYGRVGATRTSSGLPGNPVSSFVTFLLLVRPFLLKLQGADAARARAGAAARRISTGRAPTSAASSCACAATPQGGLDLFPNQSSGVLTSAVWGDGLVDNPAGPDHRARRHRALPSVRGAAVMKRHRPYFASIREALGQGGEARRHLGAPRWRGLRDELIARGGAYAPGAGARQGGAHGAEPGDERRGRAAERRLRSGVLSAGDRRLRR